MRNIADCAVVVTGASSGIGRATAVALARRGAALILTARSEPDLQEAARECGHAGGRAQVVVADLTQPAQVERVLQQALQSYGRVDVWINNAAVTAFGRIEDIPVEILEQVLRTNVLGYMLGARAVIPHFRKRNQGVLINVSSVVGTMGIPYASAYVASKFAIRGLSQTLRQELLGTGVRVSTVLPASTDTPIFQHGANYLGRAARPMPPIATAEDVAAIIVRLIESPRREVFVSARERLIRAVQALLPGWMERQMAQKTERQHFEDRPAEAHSGNLYHSTENRISGGWRRKGDHERAKKWPFAAAAAVPLVAGILWKRHPGRHPAFKLLWKGYR